MLMANGTLTRMDARITEDRMKKKGKHKKEPGTCKALDVGAPKNVKVVAAALSIVRHDAQRRHHEAFEPSPEWVEKLMRGAAETLQSLALMDHCPKCRRRAPRMPTDSGMTSSGHCSECWLLAINTMIFKLREKIGEKKASIAEIEAAEPIAPPVVLYPIPYTQLQDRAQDGKAERAMHDAMEQLAAWRGLVAKIEAIAKILPQVPESAAAWVIMRLDAVMKNSQKITTSVLSTGQELTA